MQNNKRVLLVASDADGERIPYVLDNRTKKFLPKFLEAFAGPFWQNKDGDEPDEESSEAETFLLKCLCRTPGTLDVDGIVDRIKQDDDNHLPVMDALCCLRHGTRHFCRKRECKFLDKLSGHRGRDSLCHSFGGDRRHLCVDFALQTRECSLC